jgi:hypothetical protein
VTDQSSRGRSDLPVLPDTDPDPPVVCRKLRTKLAFGALEGLRDWRHGDSTTAAYWCLRTMEAVGPDDSFSHPHHCQTGRRCFAPPDGAELLADGGDQAGKPRTRG